MGGYEAVPNFPIRICPITDVHVKHRIPGTWRQECPGVDERTAVSDACTCPLGPEDAHFPDCPWYRPGFTTGL